MAISIHDLLLNCFQLNFLCLGKNMVPSIVDSCTEMMNKWNVSLDAKESVEVDMLPEVEALTFNIMCNALVVGRSIEETEKIHKLRLKVNQQAEKLAKLMIFPGWW